MTKKEMEAVLLEHEIAELENDVERTMATLVPNPHYEIAFLGLAIDGRDAIRELYKRILSRNVGRPVAAEARNHAVARNTLIREAHVSFDTLDGKRVTGLYMVVMEFDPISKKIVSERMYADTLFAQFMTEQIGPGLENFPGVSRITDTAPDVKQHDAYAVAARRGLEIAQPTA